MKHCVNCCLPLVAGTPKFCEIDINLRLYKTQDPDSEELSIQRISVLSALSCLLNFSIPDRDLDTLTKKTFVCLPCSYKLKELFKYFKLFLHFNKSGSFVSKKIQEGRENWDNSKKKKNNCDNITNDRVHVTFKDVGVNTDPIGAYDDHQPAVVINGEDVHLKSDTVQVSGLEIPNKNNDEGHAIDICSVELNDLIGFGVENLRPLQLPSPPQELAKPTHQEVQSNVTTAVILTEPNLIFEDKIIEVSSLNKSSAKSLIKPSKDQYVVEYTLKSENPNTPSVTVQELRDINQPLQIFQATYNLPAPEQYEKYKITDLCSRSFKCPECALVCESYLRYKDHIFDKHLKSGLYKCVHPACHYSTSNFSWYENHSVNCHSLKPIPPSHSSLEAELDNRLFPPINSAQDEALRWCFINHYIVDKLRASPIKGPPFRCLKCLKSTKNKLLIEFPTKELYYYHMGKREHIIDSPKFTPNTNHDLETTIGGRKKSRDQNQIEISKELDSSSKPSNPNRVAGQDEEVKIWIENQLKAFNVSGGRPYTCPLSAEEGCFAEFQKSSSLYAHLKSHLNKIKNKESLSCSKCSRQFGRPSELKRHVNNCGTGNENENASITIVKKMRNRKKRYLPPFICKACSTPKKTVEFPSHFKLKGHSRRIHGPSPEKKYKCEECPKTFSIIGNLKSHMISHSNERPWFCELCGKSYKSKQHMLNHQRISHTEDGRLKYNAYCRVKNKRWKEGKKQTLQSLTPTSASTCSSSFEEGSQDCNNESGEIRNKDIKSGEDKQKVAIIEVQVHDDGVIEEAQVDGEVDYMEEVIVEYCGESD